MGDRQKYQNAHIPPLSILSIENLFESLLYISMVINLGPTILCRIKIAVQVKVWF